MNSRGTNWTWVTIFVVAVIVVGWAVWSGRLPFGRSMKLPPGVEVADVKLPKRASNYTIRMTGTPGLAFEGIILEIHPNGTGTPREIRGNVPATYEARGAAVQCTCTKLSDEGMLRVELVHDGAVIDSYEASGGYRGTQVCSLAESTK